MTVRDMSAQMSNEEYVRWGIYYSRIAQRAELRALTAKGGGR